MGDEPPPEVPAEGEEGAAAVAAVPEVPTAAAEFLEACMQGKTMKVRSYVVKHPDEDINTPTGKNGWSCIQVAAGYAHADTIRALVELGANPATKDKLGMTALHVGADTDETEVMRALLESDAAKAIIDEQDADGNTALHYAAWSGRVDIIVELLRAGAKTDIVNAAGKTASEEAKEQKQDGAIKMIANGPPEPAA